MTALPISHTSTPLMEAQAHLYARTDVLFHAFPSFFESAHESGKMMVDLLDGAHKGEKTEPGLEDQEPGPEEVDREKLRELKRLTEKLNRLEWEIKNGKITLKNGKLVGPVAPKPEKTKIQ